MKKLVPDLVNVNNDKVIRVTSITGSRTKYTTYNLMLLCDVPGNLGMITKWVIYDILSNFHRKVTLKVSVPPHYLRKGVVGCGRCRDGCSNSYAYVTTKKDYLY